MSYVSKLRDAFEIHQFGGKASNLARLLQANLPVPDGLAVGLGVFSKNGTLNSDARQQIEDALDPSKYYAVRSSALAEDSLGASWAGQFETFLNTRASDVSAKIELCHNSIKARAKAYSKDKEEQGEFQVAVVVQEMVDPTYAGLSFTKDPSTGTNKVMIEYVRGLGEPLVHGDVDPERIVWNRSKKKVIEQTENEIPIPLGELISLSERVEKAFGDVPQDIEWAYDGKQIWLVQARPITTLQERGAGKHYLGDPAKLFYWGPSRALPLYMSDFMEAEQQNFDRMLANSHLTGPPKTIVIFHASQMVWLNKLAEFSEFVESSFINYEHLRNLGRDISAFREAVKTLDEYMSKHEEVDVSQFRDLILRVWRPTLPPEFALYGAEAVLSKRLDRLSAEDKVTVWGLMTLPDQPTFMQQLDLELVTSRNAAEMAQKYPWIQDGYGGVVDGAVGYFKNRLKVVQGNETLLLGSAAKRQEIAEQYALSRGEVSALGLSRGLAEFMDERKAWMMRSRQYILNVAKQVAHKHAIPLEKVEHSQLSDLVSGNSTPYYGWSFLASEHRPFTKQDAVLAWDWYIEYRASKSVLSGLVVSNGGRHFTNGEIFVAHDPTDPMPDDAILVVPSTSPSYVPLMRKARALVTDHGGMMSHAAIVAREFGLPCIVGTKRATKVLKDGDKVVLDLVKGEVSR